MWIYHYVSAAIWAWVNGIQDGLIICWIMNNRRDNTICSVILCSQSSTLQSWCVTMKPAAAAAAAAGRHHGIAWLRHMNWRQQVNCRRRCAHVRPMQLSCSLDGHACLRATSESELPSVALASDLISVISSYNQSQTVHYTLHFNLVPYNQQSSFYKQYKDAGRPTRTLSSYSVISVKGVNQSPKNESAWTLSAVPV